MQIDTSLPLRTAAAARGNIWPSMDDRSSNKDSFRQNLRKQNSEALRRSLQPVKQKSFLTVPRVVGALILLAALLMIAIGAASAHEFSSKGITVSHPWARATPGGVTVGGAYLEIVAAPGGGDRLVGGSSPVAGSLEIHNHIMEGGTAKMRRVDGLAISGGKSVVLSPGGYHVMLMGLKQPLKEGDMIDLTLSFEKAGDITVQATVEPIGAKGPHGFDSQPGHDSGGHHKH